MTADLTSEAGVATTAEQLREHAIDVRLRDLQIVHAAGLGHLGGEFSATDILVTLYFGGVLRYDPANPDDPDRDRFVLSKGHSAAALYTTLAQAGYFDELLGRRIEVPAKLVVLAVGMRPRQPETDFFRDLLKEASS